MTDVNDSETAVRAAYSEIASALADAVEAVGELKSEFSGEAAGAFFGAAASFEKKTARPLIKTARALAGLGE